MKPKAHCWILCVCILSFVASTLHKHNCLADILTKSTNAPLLTTNFDSALDPLREYIKEFADREDTPGIGMLLAQNGRVVFHEAYGFADPDFEKPFLKDTMVFLASSTKPISATAIMILVDEGHLSLDDPVSRYMPEFGSPSDQTGQPHKPPTIRHLLTHTSGWPGLKEMPPDAAMAIRNTSLTLKESAEKIVLEKLMSEPGTRFSYGGLSYNVAGRIVEIVTSQPFDRFIENRLLTPLGMKDTTFKPTSEQGNRVAGIFKPAPWGGQLNLMRYDPDRERKLLMIGGGLYSTAWDLAIFLQMHLNEGVYGSQKILSDQTVKEMQKDQIGVAERAYVPLGTMNSYGLGWIRERSTERDTARCVSHAGAFGSVVWIDNERNLIGIIFTPIPLKFAYPIHEKIRAKIRQSFPVQ